MKPHFAVVSGPDAYHWQHTVTIHKRRKDAMAALEARPTGWVGVVSSRHQERKWEPSRLAIDYATDPWTEEVAVRFTAHANGNPPSLAFA
jgi:hypothetical protein